VTSITGFEGLLAHPQRQHNVRVGTGPYFYSVRLRGHLGQTALSAFPAMVAHVEGRETVLTGRLEDQSAVFGVLGQIEALGLELIELRRVRTRRSSSSPDR
jgi:hypothetical protein